MHGVLVLVPVIGGMPVRPLIAQIGWGCAHPPLIVPGCADIALARNRLISTALELTAKEPSYSGVDTLFFLDADCELAAAGAQALVDASRLDKRAHSGVYLVGDGSRVVGYRDHRYNSRWATGLGAMAIPLELLRDVTRDMPRCETGNGDSPIYPICTTGPKNGRWEGEDIALCRALGGVVMDPIAVAHHKVVPLIPDQETLNAVKLAGTGP